MQLSIFVRLYGTYVQRRENGPFFARPFFSGKWQQNWAWFILKSHCNLGGEDHYIPSVPQGGSQNCKWCCECFEMLWNVRKLWQKINVQKETVIKYFMTKCKQIWISVPSRKWFLEPRMRPRGQKKESSQLIKANATSFCFWFHCGPQVCCFHGCQSVLCLIRDHAVLCCLIMPPQCSQ